MINWLHSVLHDPSRGWDPISADYAEAYGRVAVADPGIVDRFAHAVHGIRGKEIADIGSGPGHYSLEFARLGAHVTCVDVSRTYLTMAAARVRSDGFNCRCALGYLDRINEITSGTFDGIFCNVSWYYCMNDFAFARQLLRAIKPGGVIMIRETTEAFDMRRSRRRRFVYWLNNSFGWKIGHPYPKRGRIAMAFEKLNACRVEVDYSDSIVDIVVTTRIADAAG